MSDLIVIKMNGWSGYYNQAKHQMMGQLAK